MTNRVSYGPQDLQKICKQAERDRNRGSSQFWSIASSARFPNAGIRARRSSLETPSL